MSEGKDHGLAAGDRNRTDDHLFTNRQLYHLSYPANKSQNDSTFIAGSTITAESFFGRVATFVATLLQPNLPPTIFHRRGMLQLVATLLQLFGPNSSRHRSSERHLSGPPLRDDRNALASHLPNCAPQ